MARITIEDCIEQVPNRFQLVQMTAIRAKQLKRGAMSLVKAEENKEAVVALREIAAGLVTADDSPAAALPEDELSHGLADEATVEVVPVPPAEPASEDEGAEGEEPAGE